MSLVVHHSYFISHLEMAATEVDAMEQINQLKVRIESRCKKLPRKEKEIASQESLLTFQDLEDFSLVVQQCEFEVRWKQTNALYYFTDTQGAFVVDEDVFVQWLSAAVPEAPQVFGQSDSTSLSTFHALMLYNVPFCRAKPSTGKASPSATGKRVFSTIVVFVHPLQHLLPIEEGVDMLLVLSSDSSHEPCSALCRLPERNVREFYPCLTHSMTLMLPYSIGEEGPIMHLDTSIHLCGGFAI